MRIPKNLLSAGLAALLGLTPSARAADVALSGGWFRVLPAGLPAAGYFELHNGTGKTVSLVSAASPGCGMLMLHQSQDSGGMSRMVDVQRVDVAPGTTVKFAPGGYHLMCMDPTPLLKPGARVAVTLQFADGSKLTSNFVARNIRGK
jgi:periplasmic copper chaperone A